MSIDRKNYGVALGAAERIRRFWRERDDADLYEPVEVRVTPLSYELQSNLQPDGYPPRRE